MPENGEPTRSMNEGFEHIDLEKKIAWRLDTGYRFTHRISSHVNNAGS